MTSLTKKTLTLVFIVLIAGVALRAYWSTQGPALQPWHTIVPDELSVEQMRRGDWPAYLAAESGMFAEVHRKLQSAMTDSDRTPLNRYYDPSLASPTAFERDWNRSFVLEPDQAPLGVVVLLHGLTDSPYSVRALADLYRQHGFVAIAPRIPGHGSVPGALTKTSRQQWLAAVELTIREANRRAAGKLPLHLVGYSNGGALALMYVLSRISSGQEVDVDQLVLLSPMIGVTSFARYAGLAGLPAVFSRYAKSAWLDLLPEYNPFKYNSFPVRAARESYLLTADLQSVIDTLVEQHRTSAIPPVLTFLSVVDDTVDAQQVMSAFYEHLPDNGSELVLFDVNRNTAINPIFRADIADWPQRAYQSVPPRNFALTVVGAASGDDPSVVARTLAARSGIASTYPLGVSYPRQIFSLSHIALPFQSNDPLYGSEPLHLSTGRDNIHLGMTALRGERNVLLVSQDSLTRLSYNPFYPYVARRIVEAMP